MKEKMKHKYTLINSEMSYDLSHDYWNDEEFEENKVFNVMKNGYSNLEQSQHLLDVYEQFLTLTYNELASDKKDFKNCNIISVGAGIGWLEAWWLKDIGFKNLSLMDFSKHRIHKIAPELFRHYDIRGNVNFIHGSMENFNFDENSIDICIMIQAFHHYDQPLDMLRRLKKVLKSGGVVIIAGEPDFTNWDYFIQSIKHFVKYILNYKNYRRLHHIFPGWQDLFPPDIIKGDIHYSQKEYIHFFERAGFNKYITTFDKAKRIKGMVLVNA
jgi:ubiquinone/menaquinone biosynthesis C-methylase UbiE